LGFLVRACITAALGTPRARPVRRWMEGPLACVVADRDVTADELRDFLAELGLTAHEPPRE
jgi:hypothetical protein